MKQPGINPQLESILAGLPALKSPFLRALTNPPAWQILHEHPLPDPNRQSQLLTSPTLDSAMRAALQTEWELRKQAVTKFGTSAKMLLFTRNGLEQATPAIVARLRAEIFKTAGVTQVVDLGCGLGSDSIAFAEQAVEVVGVDLDPGRVFCARHNLWPYQFKVELGEAAEYLGTHRPSAVFVDPARRNARGRALQPEAWSPPLDKVLSWQNTAPYLAVKVAPGLSYDQIPDDFHARWVSLNGSLVEAGLYSSRLLSPGRSAVVINDGQIRHFALTEIDSPNQSAPVADPAAELGAYLYEPDPAIIRCGAVAELAKQIGAAPVGEKLAYLTGPTLHSIKPLATTYRILDELPMRAKTVRRYLQERQITRLDIKKRGVQVTPEVWRKKVLPKPKAKTEAKTLTMVLTRVLGEHRALVVEPLD